MLKAIAQIRRDSGAPASGNPVPGDRRHLGRRDQRRRAGLPRRRLRRRRRRPRRGLGELPRRAGLPLRFDRRDPHRRALADDDVDRLGDRALAPRPAALAARQHAARGAARASWSSTEPAASGDGATATCMRSRSPRRATARACTSPSTTRSTTSCRGRARSGSRCATAITIPHLLASSAIPFVFPAVALDIDGAHRILRRRLDAPVGADLAGGAPGRRAHPRRRRRPHARAAGRARRQQRLPEPRADRRPCAVEHLPRRARRRRRAAAAHQRDAGAAAAAGAAPRRA